MQPKSHLYERTAGRDIDADYTELDHTRESSRKNRYVRHGTFSTYGWGLELLSSFTTLALFAGMVAIFCSMSNKPYSEWPLSISINTTIAILSTACTAAMMHNVSAFIGQLKWLHFKRSSRSVYNVERFDEASRGPYGAILLIFRVPWNLATLGAFITILRLGFSPLSQAVVSLESRMVDVPSNDSTFGYAHAYDRNRTTGAQSEIPPDTQMQSAILQGLYDISSIPVFNCGGACLWRDSYVSLGFKSTCKNVTMSALETKHCIKPEGRPGMRFDRNCNFTTPGNITLTTQHVLTDSQTTFRINATRTHLDHPNNITTSLDDIVRIAVWRSGYDTSFNATDINITECTVGFTAYEYSRAEANGSTFSFRKVAEMDPRHTNWSWEDPMAQTHLVSNKSSNLPPFKISIIDIKALQDFFESTTFQSEFVSGNAKNNNPGLSAALAGDANLTRAFDNMALGMTDYLRSGPNKKLAQGVRRESEIFVLIRWYWLIGPAVIELAALIFAVCTIVGTASKHEVPLWKSSALVLLSCRHDMNSGIIHGEFQDIKELEKMANVSKARLE
ncbi:uncharacterized protein BKA55DRAFT_531338 [Fusarium redolens]|uniref:Uncharacterized protein n=1 Tax=Fusarium redolens TaxID=48865 RepID=A0A9P9FU71_FUSRE|nr:uncharacterized protein BKA55DRAFT_531338 [Fusarium redolens]KAH7202871.1 hypothetical protein BKA55DRAFT_531338 [Fusarium redolens]